MSTKRLMLAATLAAMTGSGIAAAADLPSRAAPPVFVPPPIPVFTWTGFYAGVNAGAVDQEGRQTTSIAPGTHLVLPPNLATAAAAGTGSASHVGFIGGGQIGYNHQVGAFVFGVEADAAYIDGSAISTGAGTLNNPRQSPLSIVTSERAAFLATGRARVGYAFDRALIYATGGVALTDQRVSQTYADQLFATSGGFSRSSLRAGFAVGGGVEYALSQHWSVKAEYLYVRFDVSPASYTILSRTGGTNVLTVGGHQDLQIGRVGLNYRFDTSLPVVARY